ncbi:hypothetical protein [Methylocaldum sp.]|jgi:hypothetical protein|uniref:hypothetical protein n=1 Tax=Methylocaldum sp. TaxID=1969727 RepID=UPI00321FB745
MSQSERRRRFHSLVVAACKSSTDDLVAVLRHHADRMTLLHKAAVIRVLAFRGYCCPGLPYPEARQAVRKSLGI